MKPMVVDNLNELFKTNPLIDTLQKNELFELIDKSLPVKYRENYLKMLHGDKVSKADRTTILEEITNIIKKNNDQNS